MNYSRKTRAFIYGLIFVFFIVILYILITNPIFGKVKKSENQIVINKEKLKNHITFLTTLKEERSYLNTKSLNEVGEYIYNYFTQVGCDKVQYQKYQIDKREYKNVVCNFNGKSKEKIVLGAHYDVFGDSLLKNSPIYSGADDNGSGVAGILEISRLIGKNKQDLNNNLEIVAYTLEEPPFFDSPEMGSYIHAKSLNDNKEEIKYMLNLEMIGYFSDEKIQTYPVNFLSRIYPEEGDFIAIVGELFDSKIKQVKRKMIENSNIDVWSLSGPSSIKGLDFSDHRNYWHFGYKAYMITDTSYYRNKNYHTLNDTIDTLDFDKMSEVVRGVYGVIMK